MARPQKDGLLYFPFDIGFFSDRKIRLLRGEHNAEGVEVYMRLICKIYEDNGYFMSWSDDEDCALLADETGCSKDKIRMIVSTCTKCSLFDNTTLSVSNVLTSRGIQRRYFTAIKNTRVATMKAAAKGNRQESQNPLRYTTIEKDLCLLGDDDISELNKSHVWLKVSQNDSFSMNNEGFSMNNEGKSSINPPKKRKEKESKVKDSKEDNNKSIVSPSARFQKPSLEDVELYCRERGNNVDPEYFIDFYESNGWKVSKNPMKDWKAAIRNWERRGASYSKSATAQNPNAPKQFKSASEKSQEAIMNFMGGGI